MVVWPHWCLPAGVGTPSSVSVLAMPCGVMPLRDRDLAVCKALSLAPCAVLGDGPAFFLREARHDGQQDFAFTVEGPDVFLLEIDLDAVFLQLSDGGQGVDCVPRKAADGLGDDQVDLAVHRIRDHAFEALAVLGAGARDALVGVHGHKLPIVPALDVIGVVIDLRLIARELIVVISGDASIPGDLPFLLRGKRRGRKPRQGCWDCLDFPLLFQYRSLLTCFMCSLMAFLRSGV